MNVKRYYAKESPTQRDSWNVYDREGTAPEGGHAVEIAHETRLGATSCAECLNDGRDAYAWLGSGDSTPHYVSSEDGPGGCIRLSNNVRVF